MPPISLDRELIRRVLRHLLENAARYSPAGSPVNISATLEADRLLVSITDQGQGIDDAEQAYIFDKFYRGSRQRMLHGTGMGLAIAKAILRAHGGGIEVVSHRDQGATFTFWAANQAGVARVRPRDRHQHQPSRKVAKKKSAPAVIVSGTICVYAFRIHRPSEVTCIEVARGRHCPW